MTDAWDARMDSYIVEAERQISGLNAEIARLRAENERLKLEAQDDRVVQQALTERIGQLTHEVETLRKEAAAITDWCVSPAECMTCGHKWFAVYPLGAGDLECSKCHGTDTYRGESIP